MSLPVVAGVVSLKKNKQLVLFSSLIERITTHHHDKQEHTQREHLSWQTSVFRVGKHLRRSISPAPCKAFELDLKLVALGVLPDEWDSHAKVCNLEPTLGVSDIKGTIDEEVFGLYIAVDIALTVDEIECTGCLTDQKTTHWHREGLLLYVVEETTTLHKLLNAHCETWVLIYCEAKQSNDVGVSTRKKLVSRKLIPRSIQVFQALDFFLDLHGELPVQRIFDFPNLSISALSEQLDFFKVFKIDVDGGGGKFLQHGG